MSQPTLTLIEQDLTEEDREAVCAPLRTYNRERNGEFFAKRDLPEHAARKLNLVARDSEGRIVGGLIAETQFTWLKIEILSVAPESRHRGIGSLLMNAAETEARARGCQYAYLDTADYQAPLFYEKRGYTVAGKLPDWDSHGHAKYLFVKRLG